MPQGLPVAVLRERTLGVLPVSGLVADPGSGRTLGCGLCFIKERPGFLRLPMTMHCVTREGDSS